MPEFQAQMSMVPQICVMNVDNDPPADGFLNIHIYIIYIHTNTCLYTSSWKAQLQIHDEPTSKIDAHDVLHEIDQQQPQTSSS